MPLSLNLGLDGLSRWRVGRWRWRRLYPAGPHVGEELVRDLSQDVFSEPGHAQDVAPSSVNVVPEWNELRGKRNKKREFKQTLKPTHHWERVSKMSQICFETFSI